MKKSVLKFMVALLTLTTVFGGVGSAFAVESRVIDNPELITKSDTRTGNGCSLKLTASAYDYLSYLTAGYYSLTPYYPGCTYEIISSGWSKNSATSLTCKARGLFIPNSSGNGFYLSPSVTITT